MKTHSNYLISSLLVFWLSFLVSTQFALAQTVPLGEKIGDIVEITEFTDDGHANLSVFSPNPSMEVMGSKYLQPVIDWELGGYLFEDVKDLRINVTVYFSYSLACAGANPTRSEVNLHGEPYGPKVFSKMISSGSSSGNTPRMFQTTIGNLGVSIGIMCWAYGGTSSAQLDVEKLTIEFVDVPQPRESFVYIPQKDKNQPKDPNKISGDPVNVVNGNMYITATDLSVFSPGVSFVFARSYNSINEEDGPLGVGWTHSYNIRLIPPEDTMSPITITGSLGADTTFHQVEPYVFYSEEGEHSSLELIDDGQKYYAWIQKDQTEYRFSEEGVLETIIDKNGNSVLFSYDNLGNLITVSDSVGREYTILYDSNNHIESVSDPSGRAVNYQYDDNDNLVVVTNPLGEQTIYEYEDPLDIHNITKQINNHSFTFLYSYDQDDRCTYARGLNGELGTTFEYHPDESYTRITDGLGNVTIKYYNQYGNIERIEYADGTMDQFIWDDSLNKVQETDQGGATWIYEYDDRGNMVKLIDPLNNVSTMVFDGSSNLISVTDALGQTTTLDYDENGNLVSNTYPDGKSVTYTYYTNGQLEQIYDTTGNSTTFSYDADGNLILMTSHEGDTVSYSYDSIGRKIAETDSNGKITTYQYDALDRVIKVVDALGGEITNTHKNGGLGSLTDQNANTTQFDYDSVEALVETTDPIGQTKSIVYDNGGNVVSFTDYTSQQTTYQYDSLNRVTRADYPDATFVVYDYDNLGRVTQMEDSSGISSFSYDTLGRLSSYTTGFGKSVSYSYDAVGNLKTLTYPGNRSVEYTYDTNGRMTQISDWAGRITSYSYNDRGLLDSVSFPNGVTTSYDYDNNGARLVGVTHRKSNDDIIAQYYLTLDGNGNVISSSSVQPLKLTSVPVSTASFEYGPDNRLQVAGDVTVTHDNNGNMLTKGGNTYGYNSRNQLISVNSGQESWTYSYDGHGNRLSRNHNGSVTHYLNDISGMTKVLVEYDDSGEVLSYFVYGLGLAYKIDANDDAYFYHYDHIGNTVALTDETGEMVNKYAYTPFGVVANSEEGTLNPFRFSGRYGVSSESNGLVYMRARYYDPDLGRFISKDPIGFDGGINLYAYVYNNPGNRIDPLGLCGEDTDKSWLDHYRDYRKRMDNFWNSDTGLLVKTVTVDVISWYGLSSFEPSSLDDPLGLKKQDEAYDLFRRAVWEGVKYAGAWYGQKTLEYAINNPEIFILLKE